MKRLSWPWVISWRLYGIYDPGGLCLIPVLLNFTEHLSLFLLLFQPFNSLFIPCKTMSTVGNVIYGCSTPVSDTSALLMICDSCTAVSWIRFNFGGG